MNAQQIIDQCDATSIALDGLKLLVGELMKEHLQLMKENRELKAKIKELKKK